MNNFYNSDQYIARTTRTWSGHAGEVLEVEFQGLGVGDVPQYYAFGSELACLRLYYRMKVGRVGYNATMNKWYYINAN